VLFVVAVLVGGFFTSSFSLTGIVDRVLAKLGEKLVWDKFENQVHNVDGESKDDSLAPLSN
jgi:hypothetical protein